MKSKVIQLKTNRIHLQPQRLAKAKRSYATRCLPSDISTFKIDDSRTPNAGDVVLAKIKRLGQHRRIELVNGRRARMFERDDIVVVYGNRYAPDQFEAIVPEKSGACHLVAAGGIAAQMVYKHAAMKKPTEIESLGALIHDDGRVVKLKDYAIQAMPNPHPLPPVIAVVGGSMNTGKTTAVASLVRGLTLAGFRVNAGKVTGTGSGCDSWHIMDAGAGRMMDFLDSGYASTYLLSPAQVEEIFVNLVSHLNQDRPDYIVLEVADGTFQMETANLITAKVFRETITGVLFTAADSLGAVHGVEMLQRWGLPVFAVSGILSRSPLAMREALDFMDVPIVSRKALADPAIKQHLATWIGHERTANAARRNG